MYDHTPDNPQQQTQNYVYVIEQDGGEYVKVGVTDNPKARLRNLQHGSPLRLEISLLIQCADETSALQVESFFHAALQYCAAYGEWFHVSANEVRDLWTALRLVAPAVTSAQLEGESVIRHAQRPLRVSRKFKAKSRYVLDFLNENPQTAELEQVEIAHLVTVATGVTISQSTVSRALQARRVQLEQERDR